MEKVVGDGVKTVFLWQLQERDKYYLRLNARQMLAKKFCTKGLCSCVCMCVCMCNLDVI